MTRVSVPFLLLAVASVAAASATAATEGSLRAGSLAHEGAASQEGQLGLLFLQETGDEEPSTPWVLGTAASMRVIEYTTTQSEVTLPPSPLPVGGVPTPRDPQPPVETILTAAEVRLGEHQSAYEAHAFAVDGFLDYSARSDDRALKQQATVAIGRGVFGSDDFPGTPTDLESSDFAAMSRDGPFVLHRGESTRSEVTVSGSFVLEVFGLTLDVRSAEGESRFASGTFREPVVEGADAAADVRNTFIRIFLEDAEVSLAVDGGSPRIEWATSGLALQADGAVTFYHTFGSVKRDGEPALSLEDERYVLPAGSLLAITPQADGLKIDVSETAFGPRGTIADVPAPASAALVGSGAVLALLVAVGIGLLRRVVRMPQLAEVERAIEEGEYRRAARMAGRIVARRPQDESALLARGIALSKAGQHQRTVRELSDHLARVAASDGSLHYVLGLAQLDLGQRDAARVSLREAVRLTPSLHAEVGSRLGKAFSAPAATTKETSGYA